MAMVHFTYNDKDKVNIQMNVDDENINLTQLFAYFVDFTRMMGYHPGSWARIIEQLNTTDLSDDYTINDWVNDILVEV